MFNLKKILACDLNGILHSNGNLSLPSLIKSHPDVIVFALNYYRVKASISAGVQEKEGAGSQELKRKNLYRECYDLLVIEIGKVLEDVSEATAKKLIEATDAKSLEYFGRNKIGVIPISIEKLNEHHHAQTDALLSEFLTHKEQIPLEKLYMYQSAYYMTGKILTQEEARALVFDRVTLILQEQDSKKTPILIENLTKVFLVIMCLPVKKVSKQVSMLTASINDGDTKELTARMVIENIVSYTVTENIIEEELNTGKKSLLLLVESLLKYQGAIVDLGLSLYQETIKKGLAFYHEEYVSWKVSSKELPVFTAQQKSQEVVLFSTENTATVARPQKNGVFFRSNSKQKVDKPVLLLEEFQDVVIKQKKPYVFMRNTLAGGMLILGASMYAFGAFSTMTVSSALVVPYLGIVNRKGIFERMYGLLNENYDQSDERVIIKCMSESVKQGVIQNSETYEDFCADMKRIISEEIGKQKIYPMMFSDQDIFDKKMEFSALHSLINATRTLRTG